MNIIYDTGIGLPYSRLMLAGFSQGGAMSLFTGLQLPVVEGEDAATLAGLVVMSGYLPGRVDLYIVRIYCVCHTFMNVIT